MWSVLGKNYRRVDSSGLTQLFPGKNVDFDGTGEILSVSAIPTPGQRTLTFDPDTGLIADEQYVRLPTSYVIERYEATSSSPRPSTTGRTVNGRRRY